MSRYNFSSDSYLPDDRDERERNAESRSDADREENPTQTKNIYDFSTIYDWDSHRPMLIWALQKLTTGTVIELGVGHGSTPVLDRICREQKRNFEPYESNLNWAMNMLEQYSIPVVAVMDYDEVIVFKCAILFVDNAPGERRRVDVERWANKAQIIIVHDTEPGAEYVYGLANIIKKFKYRCTLKNKLGLPETTAVSNSYDFRQWRGVRAGEFWFE